MSLLGFFFSHEGVPIKINTRQLGIALPSTAHTRPFEAHSESLSEVKPICCIFFLVVYSLKLLTARAQNQYGKKQNGIIVI